MCNNWKESIFDNLSCVGKVNYNSTGDIIVKGRIKKTGLLPLNGKMIYWAPAPPDYRVSMTGSGLPFSNFISIPTIFFIIPSLDFLYNFLGSLSIHLSIDVFTNIS